MFIGIDPGVKGCLAVLHSDTREVKFFDWSSPLSDYFESIISYLDSQYEKGKEVRFAVLERIHAMPKQGVNSMFSMGCGYGYWLAFLTLCKLPHQTTLPQTWQKNMLSKHDGISTKTQAYIMAKRMFPKIELHGPKGGMKDGRADAIMIAVYASKQV